MEVTHETIWYPFWVTKCQYDITTYYFPFLREVIRFRALLWGSWSGNWTRPPNSHCLWIQGQARCVHCASQVGLGSLFWTTSTFCKRVFFWVIKTHVGLTQLPRQKVPLEVSIGSCISYEVHDELQKLDLPSRNEFFLLNASTVSRKMMVGSTGWDAPPWVSLT